MEKAPMVAPQLPEGAEYEAAMWRFVDQLRNWRGDLTADDILAVFAGLAYASLPSTLRLRTPVSDRGLLEYSPLFDESLMLGPNAGLLAETVELILGRDLPAPVLQRLLRQISDAPIEFTRTILDWVRRNDPQFGDGRSVLQSTLETVISAFTQRSALGEHHTSPWLAEFMVALADLRPSERVYDPCFGFGGLLVTASAHLSPDTGPSGVPAISGTEINGLAYLVGLTRLAMADRSPALHLGDAIENAPHLRDERFDCVLMTPPWNGRDPHRREPGGLPVRTQNLELEFIQRALLSVSPGGRAIIAASPGFAFRTGAEQQVRDWILSEFSLEGVVTVPPGMVGPYTSLGTCVMVVRRSIPTASAMVRLMVVEPRPARPRSQAGAGDLAQLRADARELARQFRAAGARGTLDVPQRGLHKVSWQPNAQVDPLVGDFVRELRRLDPEVAVRPLEATAEVLPGIRYQRQATVEVGSGEGVPLIRVGDIAGGQIASPPLRLHTEVAARLSDETVVREGDVLLTTSGSIGKVAVVRPEVAGALATSGITILRPRGVEPEYLAALLGSAVYQRWLTNHAAGVTIPHLPPRTLRELPVPIPGLRRRRIFASTPGRLLGSLSPLALAAQLLKTDAGTPVLDLLTSPAASALVGPRKDEAAQNGLVALERISATILTHRNRVAHELDDVFEDEPLRVWLLGLGIAARQLRGISQVPAGPTRYALLEGARRGIERAVQDLGRDGSNVVAARDFTRALDAQLAREETHLLSDGDLAVVGMSPPYLEVGKVQELVVRLVNQSVLPLRDVTVTTHPDLGTATFPFVSERGEVPAVLRIPDSRELNVGFRLAWRATQMDGSPRTGEIALVIERRPNSSARRTELPDDDEIGASPYIVGRPIERDEMLFGRSRPIAKIKRSLARRDTTNVVLLEGNRRAGKTSILKYLQRDPSVTQGWLPVYCSLQAGEGSAKGPGLETREVFHLIAREIGKAAIKPPLNLWPLDEPRRTDRPAILQFFQVLDEFITEDRPFERFEQFLDNVLKVLRPRGLLLLLDEFDKLQEGIDSGITSPQVPENIRYALHAHTDFAAILTGSRRLKRLREEYWSALFGLGTRVPVGPLDEADALQLVTEPARGSLVFVPEAAKHLIFLCACQPFLIQSLCNALYDEAAESGERTITLSAVIDASSAMVHDNEHFRTLWGYAESDIRRLILQLSVELSDEPDPITSQLLQDRLRELGIPRTSARFSEDIASLRELELLQEHQSERGMAYRVAVPLMATWIREHVDFQLQLEAARREGETLL